MYPEEFRAKINESGRVVIPAPLRQEYGIQAGDELIFRRGDGEIVFRTPRMALKRIQAMVQSYTKGESMVEELFKMRREDNSA